MSYFSGSKLRRIRAIRRMSITDVFEATGISRAQISRIENGKSDPRMSTVTQLLSCYGADLGDLESNTPKVRKLSEVRSQADEAAERLQRLGLGPSNPADRLSRKAELGQSTALEREALATRS